MKYMTVIFILFAVLISACSADPRTAAPVANVQIGEVYIKASEINPADRSAPLWMAVRNTGTAPAVLVKVESAFVTSTELRNGDKPIQTVEIPAGATVDFTPTGNHARFIGLKDGLKAGDQFGAGLLFASTQLYSIQVNIRP